MKAKKAISSPKDELTKAAGIYCLQTKKLMIVATHLAIKIRPALTLDRHLTSDSSNFLEIDRSKGNANSLLHLSSHNTPGVDDHGVPIAASLRVVLTCLRRRYHVALCFDGSRPE